jgi:hypothetical protein
MTDTIELLLERVAALDDEVIDPLTHKIGFMRDQIFEAQKERAELLARAGDEMQATGCTMTTAAGRRWGLRRVPPKPIVQDPDAVPDDLCKFTRRPDMAVIRKALAGGQAVSGVAMDNGGVTIVCYSADRGGGKNA